MSEIVDRVAKALHGHARAFSEAAFLSWEQMSETARDTWRAPARAGIAAMREPTAEMSFSGTDTTVPFGIWRAMIDAALKEPPR